MARVRCTPVLENAGKVLAPAAFILFAVASAALLAASPCSYALASEAAGDASLVPVYRMYNPVTSEHLWTTDVNEYYELLRSDWRQEGVAWSCPDAASPDKGAGVVRLYNAGLGTHHYTASENEIATLTESEGWTADFNGQPLFYSADEGDAGASPVYRLYNGPLSQHLLTISETEYGALPALDWTQEKVSFYAYRAQTAEFSFAGAKVCFMGDSITAGQSGIGPDTYYSRPFPAVFGEIKGCTVANVAVGGATAGANSEDGEDNTTLNQVGSVPEDSECVIMMFGTNEWGNQNELGVAGGAASTTKGGLSAAIRAVRERCPGAVVYGIIPPQAVNLDDEENGLGLTLNDYKQAIREVYEAMGISVVDFSAVGFRWDCFAGDYTQLHPDAEGHVKFGQYLASSL